MMDETRDIPVPNQQPLPGEAEEETLFSPAASEEPTDPGPGEPEPEPEPEPGPEPGPEPPPPIPEEQPYYVSVLTDKGLALLSKQQLAMAQGENMEVAITRAEAGEGYVEPTTLAVQTAVADPVAEMELGPHEAVAADPKAVRLRMRLSSAELAGTALIRQVGVYAEDPDEGEILYYLLQYRWDVPQPLSSVAASYGAISFFESEVILTFANGEAAVIPQSPGWFLNRADLDAHDADPGAHPALQPNTYIATVEHDLGILPCAVLYPSEYAYGVGGYGEAPYGGGDFDKNIPVRLQPVDWNTVKVFTVSEYAGYTQVAQVVKNHFSLSSPGNVTTLNLILR